MKLREKIEVKEKIISEMKAKSERLQKQINITVNALWEIESEKRNLKKNFFKNQKGSVHQS